MRACNTTSCHHCLSSYNDLDVISGSQERVVILFLVFEFLQIDFLINLRLDFYLVRNIAPGV